MKQIVQIVYPNLNIRDIIEEEIIDGADEESAPKAIKKSGSIDNGKNAEYNKDR